MVFQNWGSKLFSDIKITAEVGFRIAVDCIRVLIDLPQLHFAKWSGNMGL